MLQGLLVALAFAPLYWLACPARYRREALAIASLVGLTIVDWRLLPFLLLCAALLAIALRVAGRSEGRAGVAVTSLGVALLFALFCWNKLEGDSFGALSSQNGLVLLGVSFLVLKAAGALIETARGSFRDTGRDAGFLSILGWLAFLPTYASGPMEELEHFREQEPQWHRGRALRGLERILFGLVKTLLLSHYLGVWLGPVMAAPEQASQGVLLLGAYAVALRFYFDFSGYSDIAIGLSAIFGIEIDENFDNPLGRRNLVLLWQHWHMTLTRWLRAYLFIPISRRMLRSGRFGDWPAIIAGQVTAMTFCGLWHGLSPHFALWGFLHALGLIWVGVVCRDLGRRLPTDWVMWWRRSPIAYAISTAITFNAFALSSILVVKDMSASAAYMKLLLGL